MMKQFYPGLNYLPEIDFLIRFKIACKFILWRSKKVFSSDINNANNYTRKLGIKLNIIAFLIILKLNSLRIKFY